MSNFVSYDCFLVNESLQIGIEYSADTINDDIEKLKAEVSQKKDSMQKNIESFQGETSTVPFSTVHTSIIDFLDSKATLEYLQLARSARSGNTESAKTIGAESQSTQE